MKGEISVIMQKIKNKQIKVAVVGLGYVGLPLALEFAKRGLSVIGIEIDKHRVNQLRRKTSYITDVTSRELKEVCVKRDFGVLADFKGIEKADVVIICVPTPLKRKYYPDISYIKKAVRGISRHIKKGTLVVLESTTYPGTTEEVILPLLEHKGFKHNRDFYLCFSPERIDPGNLDYPVHKIPKVIGGITPVATQLGVLLYKNIIEKVVPVSSTRVAEVVKLLENTFRLVNIGLIDELAMMAHKMKVDIWEVISAASTKPFGFMPFLPGPGVGGHCIPKDPLYLYWKARHQGFKSRFIKLASGIITAMPEYVVNRMEEELNRRGIAPNKAKILLMGVTYKKDVLDLRKSPALDIIEILARHKVAVSYYDPLVPYLSINQIDLKSIKLSARVLRQFDCILICAAHTSVNYSFILKNSQMIFDTRNVYKRSRDAKIYRL